MEDMGDVLRTRATRASHRASLRCLGLTAGIAIALTGCFSEFDYREPTITDYGNWTMSESDGEITADQYSMLRGAMKRRPALSYMVKHFLKDGVITASEWNEVLRHENDLARAEEEARTRRAAQELANAA